jgi:hypothetical protein
MGTAFDLGFALKQVSLEPDFPHCMAQRKDLMGQPMIYFPFEASNSARE